jgi:hypothetical protein
MSRMSIKTWIAAGAGLMMVIAASVGPGAERAAADLPPYEWFRGVIKSEDPDAYGRCLDVYNWGGGPWIQMWTCHEQSNQRWVITRSTETGRVVIRTEHTGMCVDGYRGPGQQLVQWSCDGSLEQEWILQGQGRTWRFENARHRGQCMDVYDWGRGHQVQLWNCHGSDNQWFYLRED